LPCAVTIHGDEMTVDWTGAPPQLPRGGINCTYHYTAAHTTYVLKSILTPEIPSNAGCFRPLHVTAPEGSVLSCRYPASVNQRTQTGWYCGPAVFKALAAVLPDRVQAFTGLPMGMGAYGVDAGGRVYNDHLFQGGGQGAGAHGDGVSALLYPTSAGNVSVEMFESRTPLVVECKEFRPDSGGAGRHRGGLGQRVRVRKLRDDGRAALVDLHPHGMLTAPSGLFGGAAGSRARAYVTNGDKGLVGELLCEAVDVHPGQRVLDIATGSGNTALAAARRGGTVTGIDFVPALLERGRERAAAERLTIDFQVGDAEALGFPDASFDVVLSTFGAMFAPDQER